MIIEPTMMKYGKLIMALTSADLPLMHEIEQRLLEKFGGCDLLSVIFPFDFTDYYTQEMGKDLQKRFISFSEMILLETLPEIKHFTNDVEQRYAIHEKRRINIDPGYVTHAQMVLATTKDYSHRIYLGKGIHAELTYVCVKKRFHQLAWTYPDYRTPFAREFFEQVRQTYLQHMRTTLHAREREHENIQHADHRSSSCVVSPGSRLEQTIRPASDSDRHCG